MAERRYRLGDFELDAATGELTRIAADGRRELASRLPPQPARLLALLAEKRGELLGRDEIRAALWPDVEVDFDRSVNFCVRQIRAALGDSAAAPRYVETLPRRGYRLLPPVVDVAESAADVAAPAAAVPADAAPADAAPADAAPAAAAARAAGAVPTAPSPADDFARAALARHHVPWLAAAVIVALVAVVLLAWLRRDVGEPGLRLGIMPFRPPAGFALEGDPTRIAEELLLLLTAAGGERAAVVGPRSTAAYDGVHLRPILEELRLDYAVNGRFLDGDDGPRLLVELIRARDGAHVWVEAYDDLGPWREIAAEVAAEVASRLELETPP